MNRAADSNPRKAFDTAVEYAVQVSESYLGKMRERTVKLDGLRYLEIGPGTDFAPQLVIASHGAEVTLADKYLADWDGSYNPQFYEAFLERWGRPAEAINRVLERGGYDGVIRLVREPIENMSSIETASIEFVQSNAVLEHVVDLGQAVAELARVTLPGGIHAHQVDFRFHTSFDRPLDHLLLSRPEYQKLCRVQGTVHGTAVRMPEMIEAFTRYFWVCGIEINGTAEVDYVENIRARLPDDSPYRYWPMAACGKPAPISGLLANKKQIFPKSRHFIQ